MAESVGDGGSSSWESLNEVIDYLEFELKLEGVVETFKSEKVDKAAVAVMSDQQLADLGIKAAGDRAKLRAFCQGQENVTKDEKRAEMKRKLTEILEASKSRRGSRKQSVKPTAGVSRKSVKNPASVKKTTLKFELRWKHYVKGFGYKARRSEQGGGVRTLNMSRNASAIDCLLELKNTFFPNGKSLVGNADDMEFVLADFQLQTISMSDFSPESYKAKNRLHTPRLFLLSRDKGLSSEESDEDLMKSPFDSSSRRDTLANSGVANAVKDAEPLDITSDEAKCSERSTEESDQANEVINLVRTHSEEDVSERSTDGLIGTSDERKEIMDLTNAQYEESLAADKEKDLQKEANVRREKLRVSRENRVLHEPATHQPRVTVSVRHLFLGSIKRTFPSDCTLTALYDWVGSLSAVPEHFSLSFSPQGILYPEENIKAVASSMLCMTQRELPIPLCKDEEDEVTFFEARYDNNQDDTLDDTLPDQESRQNLSIPLLGDNDEVNFVSVQNDNVHNERLPDEELKTEQDPQDLNEVQARMPVQLLEDDPEISFVEQVTLQTLEELNAKREMAVKAQRTNHSLMVKEINRHNCVNELLSLYKDQNIVNHELLFSLKGEDAAGEGVRREVYSVFWDNFVSSYCEGCSHFTFSVSAALSQDDFVAIGRLLSHQYIQTGTIPLQISEAIIQQAVVGKVSEECLIGSFLMLLHEKEREILQQAMLGKKPFPMFDVVEILSDYGVTSVPSASNIGKILLQVSETELISKPFLYITKLKEGMGPFWQDVTDKEIHALYSVCTPTPSNVLRSLEVSAEDQQEAKVSRWLTRYIKSKDHKLLCRFLRFCTGTDLVLPYSRIKVQLVNMSNAAMRPKSQTCFNLVTMPKNYRTLAQLSDNIDFYLCNPHLWDLSDH